jgi:hypothetical protein
MANTAILMTATQQFFTGVWFLSLLVASSACQSRSDAAAGRQKASSPAVSERSSAIQPADVEALKVSRLCADSAAKFWAGWQRQRRAAGLDDSYTSHYSRERKQCLVEASGIYKYPEGGFLTSVFVFDSVEGASVASRFEVSGNPRAKDHVDIMGDEGKGIPDTPDNEASFDNLMKN